MIFSQPIPERYQRGPISSYEVYVNGAAEKIVNTSYSSTRLMDVNGNDTVQIRARNAEGVSPETEFNLTGKKSRVLLESCV